MTRRILLAGVTILLVIGLAGFAWIWAAPCSLGGCAPVEELAEYHAEGSQLLDMNGVPFAHLAMVDRRIVSLDSLPPHVPRAFIAVEDRRFYSHSGIDFRRTLAALLRNVRSGEVQEGGSTITQQLARNLFPEWLPYTERNLRRKILEARVARQIERTFDKDKILELYLNHIYLGNGAYGIEAASLAYFGKPAAELSLSEAAALAGVPQSPSRVNPKANLPATVARRDLVLDRMVEAGFITREESMAAKEATLAVVEGDHRPDGPEGSYFVEQVRRELEERIGSGLYTGGLTIYTTLDPVAQEAAEHELNRQLAAIEAGNYGRYRHQTYAGRSPGDGQTDYLQGAVVVLDARTGEVRALVGGRDFDDSRFDRATQALRQAGSAFKPFVYAVALERYRSPAHRVEDTPLRLTLSNGQVWEPRNYTDEYDGVITMREALARSKNTATVRLAQEVGIEAVVALARELGIRSEIAPFPSTALGAAEVRPIELVAAYAAFANGGKRVEPFLIREVVDRHGKVVWRASPRTAQVLDPAVAYVLTTMLQDVVNRGTGSTVRTVGFRAPAAGKTGTTNDASDAWFIGYTPEIVAGVWIGLDRPATIVDGASGGTLAAPVWGRMMRRIYESRPEPDDWAAPGGVVTAKVDRITGSVVNPDCPGYGPTYTEFFIHSTPPRPQCYRVEEYRYPWTDSLWVDEDWRRLRVDSTGEPQPEPRQDWEWEQEGLRRRLREAEEEWLRRREEALGDGNQLPGDTLRAPLPPARGVSPMPGVRQPGEITPEPSNGTADAPLPADEFPAGDRPPPRLLGVPVSPGGGP